MIAFLRLLRRTLWVLARSDKTICHCEPSSEGVAIFYFAISQRPINCG